MQRIQEIDPIEVQALRNSLISLQQSYEIREGKLRELEGHIENKVSQYPVSQSIWIYLFRIHKYLN